MQRRKCVLIVEDVAFHRKVLVERLSIEYEILIAIDGVDALDLLGKTIKKVDVILLDMIMPRMDGYTFLEIVKRDRELEKIPIIVFTDKEDMESENKILSLGACDFVSKNSAFTVLKYRLEYAINKKNSAELEEFKKKMQYDSLTGIYNRKRFFEKTEQMLTEHSDTDFIFIRCDVDRFHLINSFFGLEEGDSLLLYMATTIRKLVEQYPHYTYGRIEGDVFCYCIAAQKDKMSEMLKSLRFCLHEFNVNYDIVPSIGLYLIKDNTMPVNLIYDKASSAAKNCKGRYLEFYAFYDEKLHEQVVHHQKITNEMNLALKKEQFVVYLQMKYNLQTNKPEGAEALVRWIHPEKGIIMPNEFIPVFEQNGFITQLDYYMWEKVCILLRKWIDEGKEMYPISVNVSRINTYNSNFANRIFELVKSYNIPPRLLNLELTESAYTDNPEVVQSMMHSLQEYGFTILMDDFGSGYSSLNVLKDININILKIDMCFLSEEQQEGRGKKILTSVMQMAKSIQIPVIAEGVETQDQVDFLKSIDCEYAQGYYYSKPIPVEVYERRIKEILKV